MKNFSMKMLLALFLMGVGFTGKAELTNVRLYHGDIDSLEIKVMGSSFCTSFALEPTKESFDYEFAREDSLRKIGKTSCSHKRFVIKNKISIMQMVAILNGLNLYDSENCSIYGARYDSYIRAKLVIYLKDNYYYSEDHSMTEYVDNRPAIVAYASCSFVDILGSRYCAQVIFDVFAFLELNFKPSPDD